MGSHAILSPSAAHRWINCTAAPRLECLQPDGDSDFTLEGTLAHALGARKLKKHIGASIAEELKEITELSRYHTGEMEEYVDMYVATVLGKLFKTQERVPDARLVVERRLDLSEFVPESFGTADALIITDGVMEVIDLKYGKGVKVSAERNEQMMIYALGAYAEYGFDYNIDRVRMTIFQPRISNLSEYETSIEELLDWADKVLRPAAAKAFRGEGPQVPGEWCRFCKVKAQCRGLATGCMTAADTTREPGLLTVTEIGHDILPHLAQIKAWVSAVEEYALLQALDGAELPGYKLVEGRSTRRITDTASVIETLTSAGFEHSDVMKPEELRTLTELEKLVGKKRFTQLCGAYIDKPAGKPTLAPVDDARPAYSAAANDFAAIDNNG